MVNAFKFRVLIDQDETVFRDIEISGNQTFQDLHNAIQSAFGFDSSQMASFYMSNENWDKGQEITLMDIPFDDGSHSISMVDTKISEMILETGQKVLYVFDFMLMWCFYIDTIGIQPVNESINYPHCVREFGKAPDQYSKQIVLNPEDDQFMLKNKRTKSDSDIFEGFDDFDDIH